MEVIVVGSIFIAFVIALCIFDHTKAGKKFFGE
jgi:hypothetical protein